MNPEVDPNLNPETDEQPETESLQPEIEPTVPLTEEQPVVESPKDETDYKAKFAESTREAQILASQLADERKKNSKELTNEPTDSELQAAFPEWELMTDTEKRLARETFSAKRIATNLQQKDQEREANAAWNTDLEVAIASNPTLQGKERAFKDFANKPTHRGADIETLRKAFLYESSTSPSNPKPTPKPGLLPGNGGPRETEKPKVLSGAELKTLRETDSKKYREYVLAHPMTEI